MDIIRKRGVKGISLLLCFIFIIAMLERVGSITAEAAPTYTIKQASTVNDVDSIKKNGDLVPQMTSMRSYISSTMASTVQDGDKVWFMYNTLNANPYYYWEYDSNASAWKFPYTTCKAADLANTFGNGKRNFILSIGNENEEKSTESTEPTEPAESAEHKHNYSWVTVQEVTADQDGIEEYRCSCGRVEERGFIPYTTYIVRGLYDAVKDAPENGTAAYDSMKTYCITDYIIKKMAERPDVTTIVTFQYKEESYQMTILEGTDFTSVLTDEEACYGYFGFAAKVGATISLL